MYLSPFQDKFLYVSVPIRINSFVSLLENSSAKLKLNEAARTGSLFSTLQMSREMVQSTITTLSPPSNNSVRRCNWATTRRVMRRSVSQSA